MYTYISFILGYIIVYIRIIYIFSVYIYIYLIYFDTFLTILGGPYIRGVLEKIKKFGPEKGGACIGGAYIRVSTVILFGPLHHL